MARTARNGDETVVNLLVSVRVVVNDVDEHAAEQGFSQVTDNVVEGITSVDMEKAVGACLAGWYLQLLDDDVTVSVRDAREVEKPKDARKRARFSMNSVGALRQEV